MTTPEGQTTITPRPEVFVADEQGDHAVDLRRLRRLAAFTLDSQQVPAGMELSVFCVDRATIAELNARHLGEGSPTDVLAFPLDDPTVTGSEVPAILGDVILCPDVAAHQATERGHALLEELELLLVHGILHLLGHDHAAEDERRAMFGLTDRLLAEFRSVKEPPR